jgi:hypothetical protein
MDDSEMTTNPLPREPFAAPRSAAISDAGQRRPIVMVLGMHRSGTSLCAHILSAMGIDIADEITAAPSNARGHWERWEIVEFHDRLLRLFNRDYYGPLHDFPLPAAWWADPRVSQIKREIVAFLAKRVGDSYFGFKDPRTVRLMPLWHQILNDLKLAPKIVLCVRNPTQVARSLRERNNLDPALGEYRWLIYMIDFFRYCGGFEVCTVDYEDWFGDPCTNFKRLEKLLDVEWQQSRADLDMVLSGIVDPTLRHDQPHYDEPRQPLVRSLYRLVSDCGRDGGTRDQVENYVAQFLGFQNLQAPLYRIQENLTITAAKYPEMAQEVTALRADIDQHAATEAALRADIEQRVATEAALRADIEQRVATEAALRADTERGAEILRSSRAVAEQNAREHATATEVLRGEIASLQDRLAATERDLGERAAIAEVLQGQITSSGMRLTAAERDAREHANAAEAMQREIASLRSQLDATRDVGRAALASLRSPTAPILETPRNAGWLLAVLGRLGLRSSYPTAAHLVIGGTKVYS